MSTLKYWVWLSSLRGIGAITALKLLNAFETPEKIFFALEEDYRRTEGVSSADIRALMNKNLVSAKEIIARCEENDYRIITLNDAEYPERLKNIYDPPVLLYVRGRLPVIDDEAAVAIVGTRKCTPYGIKTAERIGYELAKAGAVVVSGLARGVDSAAARGALRAGGKVIGVVGSGLDIVYPPENGPLFRDVASAGAIISEYAPGEEASAWHFPMRNRILSGISLGVTVIEAPEKSGALITASRALEQGRDVFAVPGNVDAPACAGSNELLKSGAIPVSCGRDIAEEYARLFPEKLCVDALRDCTGPDARETEKLIRKELNNANGGSGIGKEEIDNAVCVEYIDLSKLKSELSEDEYAVISALSGGEKQIDDIITACGVPAARVLSALTVMQIRGYVRQMDGKRFKIRNPRSED